MPNYNDDIGYDFEDFEKWLEEKGITDDLVIKQITKRFHHDIDVTFTRRGYAPSSSSDYDFNDFVNDVFSEKITPSSRSYCRLFNAMYRPWYGNPKFLSLICARFSEEVPYIFLCFDWSSRTSSGRQMDNKLQLGQRAVNLPESGGGGVSRVATCNARVMAARVLSRNCCVNGTCTRRCEPIA